MLDFTSSPFAPRTEQVRGPDGKDYVVKSASAWTGVKYRSAQMAVRDPEKGTVLDWAALFESEIKLVADCLFGADGQEAIPYGFLRGWPHAAIQALITWVKTNSPQLFTRTEETIQAEIDALTKMKDSLKETDPKNSPSATGTSST